MAFGALILSQFAMAVVVSIGDYDGFQYMRPCAQGCLTHGGGDDIRNALGCGTINGFGQNECYCRADFQSPASTWLSKCATSRCGTSATIDMSSVQSIYSRYCATAMAAVATANGGGTNGGGANLQGTATGGFPKETGFTTSSSSSLRAAVGRESTTSLMLSGMILTAVAAWVFERWAADLQWYLFSDDIEGGIRDLGAHCYHVDISSIRFRCSCDNSSRRCS
jgi:hypothetical protein